MQITLLMDLQLVRHHELKFQSILEGSQKTKKAPWRLPCQASSHIRIKHTLYLLSSMTLPLPYDETAGLILSHQNSESKGFLRVAVTQTRNNNNLDMLHSPVSVTSQLAA